MEDGELSRSYFSSEIMAEGPVIPPLLRNGFFEGLSAQASLASTVYGLIHPTLVE